MKRNICLFLAACVALLNSCTTTGPVGLFGKRSPHEQYGQKLSNAGLNETALGRSWFKAAEASLNNPLQITIPHKEAGYFPADKPRASALRFEVKRGERITIDLQKKPLTNFNIYIDLWEVKDSKNKKLLAYADTGGNAFSHEVEDSGFYIIRLQPELLAAGEFTLTISKGPSLAFPVKGGKIGSLWGADRDGGLRSHEGIDIFAPKRTPALAAADGTISRVTTNQLGGKVIFMRPKGKNYSLYYAHLDEQLASAGETVKTGDTIGLVGNTGNAISTAPHLHLGIYTTGGAIDPLAFVNPVTKPAPDIKALLTNLGKYMRTNKPVVLKNGTQKSSEAIASLKSGTLVEVSSASQNVYKAILPDGSYGFLPASSLNQLNNPIKRIHLSAEKQLFDKPQSSAPRISVLTPTTRVNVLASYNEFYYVEAEEERGWITQE